VMRYVGKVTGMASTRGRRGTRCATCVRQYCTDRQRRALCHAPLLRQSLIVQGRGRDCGDCGGVFADLLRLSAYLGRAFEECGSDRARDRVRPGLRRNVAIGSIFWALQSMRSEIASRPCAAPRGVVIHGVSVCG